MIWSLGGGRGRFLSLSTPGRGDLLRPIQAPNGVTHQSTARMFQTAQLKPWGAQGEGEGFLGLRATSLALGEGEVGNRDTPGAALAWGGGS